MIETRLRSAATAAIATSVLTFALALAGAAPATGQDVKLASLVPEGSVWDRALREMGESWRETTDDEVTLRIYPGGVAGDDADIVRKMRIGQLHAGALTVAGLAEIDEAFNALSIPLFFEDYDELFHVLEELEPWLVGKLEEAGYVFLNWGHGGWAHLFSKRPVRTLAELRDLDLYTWAGDQRMVAWWKENDFQVVPLAMTDIMTGLETGMIDAVPTTPLAALSLQWFRQTPYMQELGLLPVVGATVVTRRAWDRLPEAHRDEIRAAARRAGDRLAEEIPEQDDVAVEEMKARGLEVVAIEKPAEWEAVAREFARSMRGWIVPEEAFDRVTEVRDAHRSGQGAE